MAFTFSCIQKILTVKFSIVGMSTSMATQRLFLFYVGILTVCWINCSLSVPGLSKCTGDWPYCWLLVLFLQTLFPIKRGIVFEERKNICARPIFFCKFSFYLNSFWLFCCLKHSVIRELEQATFLSYKQTETRSKFSHARTVVFPRCSNIFSVFLLVKRFLTI